jgi:RimJ/RimL family protein N-acetyltransferase
MPSAPSTLAGTRVVLRPWRDEDRAPFAAMSDDARVMEFFPALLSRAESDAVVDNIQAHFAKHGFGVWAIEVPGVAPFIGFTGLAVPRFTAAFTPCVEIAWRLAPARWGKGYATEAARLALRYGFETLGLAEIVAMAVAGNVRSRAVMERLGMSHDSVDDFDHPSLPDGHPLRRHVLYRLASTRSKSR